MELAYYSAWPVAFDEWWVLNTEVRKEERPEGDDCGPKEGRVCVSETWRHENA